MWFNIIKADGPTQDDIERLKAIRYKSEEDKRKIREYEKEKKEKLIEQLRALMEQIGYTPEFIDSAISNLPEDYSEQIKTLEASIDNMQQQAKRNLATQKSLELLNSVISENEKVTIIKEPEFRHGIIYGEVEIEGESGHIYHYNFERDPEITKEISLSEREVTDMMEHYISELPYPAIHEEVQIPMCLSCAGNLPRGDNIASMIMGLLNDESTDIEVLDKATSDYEAIDWNSLAQYIYDFIEGIELSEFIVSRFEE